MPERHEERISALEERYDHDILLIVQDAVQGLNAILDRLDAYASAGEESSPLVSPPQGESLSDDEVEES